MNSVWSIVRTGVIVMITVATLVLGLQLGTGVYTHYFALPDEVHVPIVVNQDEKDAADHLQQAGLKLDVREAKFQAKVPANRIISQDPPGGREVRQGREVSVVVSKGPETDMVPDVTGMGLRDARLALENAKLRVGRIIRREQDGSRTEEVLEQKPKAGDQARKGTKIQLVVTMGGRSAVEVPNYEGMNLDEVRDRVGADGLKLGTVSWVLDPKAPVGEVVRQNPGPRVTLAANGQVQLVVSAGSDPRQLEVHRTTVEYLVPSGPPEQDIRVDVDDATGTNTVYDAKMAPGQKMDLQVTSMGDGDMMVYSDDRLIEREKL